MKIGEKAIGKYLDPYIIAEIGVNHEGSMDTARKLIGQAMEGGAHAVKFQAYKAEKITCKFSPAYWNLKKESSQSQYELFKKYDSFGKSEYEELASFCIKCGVDFLVTPFDLEAVEFLDPLVSVFKIASADITNIPLLRKVATTKKSIILSTGASSLPEIEYAVQTIKQISDNEIALLHCVLNYPTLIENAQLAQIQVLQRVFPECIIGYSDHVVPDKNISTLEMATLLGATILEKHFTHNKNLPGNDHYHAMDKDDLKRFISKLKTYRILYGEYNKKMFLESEARRNARRSIVAARKIEKDEILSNDNLIVKRPGHGISPVFWDEIIGKKTVNTIEEDQILHWNDIEI